MTPKFDNVIEEMLYKLEVRHANLLVLQGIGNFPRINLYPEIYEVESEIRRLKEIYGGLWSNTKVVRKSDLGNNQLGYRVTSTFIDEDIVKGD